jgi:hypothetical protein
MLLTLKTPKTLKRKLRERKSLERERLPREESLSLKLPKTLPKPLKNPYFCLTNAQRGLEPSKSVLK